jgi:pectate lyase
MQAAIDAYTGTGGLVIRYNGSFNFAAITDACTQWQLPAGAIVEIKNKSNVTIEGVDGSSANFGLAIKADAQNIIIRNMTIGLLPGSIDAIGIEGQSGKFPGYVWIDHNTLFSSLKECSGAGDLEFDGLLDNKAGAHHLTYSYNYIHDHQKVALNGYSDSDTANDAMRATYHHNRFENVQSRLPLQRRGKTHIYNNYFNNVSVSGINVRMGGISLIESNYFENVANPVTSRDSSAIGYWDLRNNYVGSGITWTSPGSPGANATSWATTQAYGSTGYSYSVTPAADVKAKVIATAGAGTNLAQ